MIGRATSRESHPSEKATRFRALHDSPGAFVDRSRALFFIIHRLIDSSAHGKAAHQPSVEGFQQFGRRANILHPRIKPYVVGISIENHRHPVVDG
jgi:hypothetical protein